MCAQLNVNMTSLTTGPESIARKPGGVAFQLLQLTEGAYIVVLHVVVDDESGKPCRTLAFPCTLEC